jgi:hypothetical protein
MMIYLLNRERLITNSLKEETTPEDFQLPTKQLKRQEMGSMRRTCLERKCVK